MSTNSSTSVWWIFVVFNLIIPFLNGRLSHINIGIFNCCCCCIQVLACFSPITAVKMSYRSQLTVWRHGDCLYKTYIFFFLFTITYSLIFILWLSACGSYCSELFVKPFGILCLLWMYDFMFMFFLFFFYEN